MLVNGVEGDKPRIREIWRRCFGDPDDYINLFLGHRFQPENTFLNREQGRVTAMLFALPIQLTSGQRTFPGCYIYGVATHPDYQGRGISTRLLAETNQILKERGCAATLLVPASPSLFHFYERQGYQTAFGIQEQTVTVSQLKSWEDSALELTKSTLVHQMEKRNGFFASSELFGRWDLPALAYADREAAFLGGQVSSFPGGYLLCYPGKDCLYLKEFAAPLSLLFPALAAIHKIYQKQTYYLRLWDCFPLGNSRPFGMIHWIDRPDLSGGDAPYLSLVLD